MVLDRWKNILIGSFVIGAACIAIGFVLFLKPMVGDGKKLLKVRFVNISGLGLGTRVTYAGKSVGEVSQIQEISNARRTALDAKGKVYSYLLTLRLDSSVCVYFSDEISIRTTGLMGEKSIAILPQSVLFNESLEPVGTEILFANSVDPLEHTINQINCVASAAEQSLQHFDHWFQQNAQTFASTASALRDSATSLEIVLNAIHDQELVPLIKNSLDLISENMILVRSALVDEELLVKLGILIKDTHHSLNAYAVPLLTHLESFSEQLTSGTGTLSRLIKNDDYYLRLSSLMSKGETLMNDINHYGLLFQYNKTWQRLRTKKANLIHALDSPQEFKKYFEEEIDLVNTALGRIRMLCERAEQSEELEKVAQDDQFKRNFAILLRHAQSLSDALKLYNQHLVSKTQDQLD